MDLKGDFKLITTGTPMENHLGELWNLFNFINPGLLGSAQQFQERFALAIEKYGIKDRQEQLQKTIKPFILRRLKKDVLKDLPEKTEITLLVERSTAEEAFYEAIRRKALDNIHGQSFTNEGSKQIQVLAELMRLRRVCCHPSLINGGEHIPSSKLEALSDLLDELIENKHKALIFSQFVDYLRIIEKMVIEKGIQYKYLDGSTPLKKRKESIDQFQDGEGDLFLISLKAGGTGLNLTAADYVIHVDPWWNPAVEDQASDRAHRIGQLNPVTVYRLVSSGSIEEKIVKLHSHKRELAESLLMDTDGKIKLNSSDLIELLKN
jgi:SNF2 family DNA or RNA helicase